MRTSKRKRGKKIGFDFARRPRRRNESPADERERMIREFIRKHGVTRCPAAYSHMDW